MTAGWISAAAAVTGLRMTGLRMTGLRMTAAAAAVVAAAVYAESIHMEGGLRARLAPVAKYNQVFEVPSGTDGIVADMGKEAAEAIVEAMEVQAGCIAYRP